MDPTTSTPRAGRTRARAANPGDQASPGGVEPNQATAGPPSPPAEAGPAGVGGPSRRAAAAHPDAAAALSRLINAPNGHDRSLIYGLILGRLTSEHTAVWDGSCRRVVTLRAFYRACLADPNRRAAHTAGLCRWATAADQGYARYPLITTSWRTS